MSEILYRVYIGGVEVTRHVVGFTSAVAVNSFPRGNITIANPNFRYTSSPATSPLYDRSSVFIYIKEKPEDDWTLIVNGMLVEPKLSINASGENSNIDVTYVGGAPLQKMLLTPNSIVIRQSQSIKDVFVGHPTDIAGDAWLPDSNNIYPDGILYKTGYAYSEQSIENIFEDVDDVPHFVTQRSVSCLEAIRHICETYGLVFFIDDVNMELVVRFAPKNTEAAEALDGADIGDIDDDGFPVYDYWLRYGHNIKSINDSAEQRDRYDKITVVGLNSHWSIGEGAKEYTHFDETISTTRAIIEKAESLARVKIRPEYTPLFNTTNITVSPHLKPIMMKRIVVDDPRLGLSESLRNVVGVEHSITNDTWSLNIRLEKEPVGAGKVISEIIEDLTEDEEELFTGAAFLTTTVTPTVGAPQNLAGICVLEDPSGLAPWVARNIKRVVNGYSTEESDYGSYSLSSIEYGTRLERFGIILNSGEEIGEAYPGADLFNTNYTNSDTRSTTEINGEVWLGLGELSEIYATRVTESKIEGDTGDDDYYITQKPTNAVSNLIAAIGSGALPAPASDSWEDVAHHYLSSRENTIISDFGETAVEMGINWALKSEYSLGLRNEFYDTVSKIDVVVIREGGTAQAVEIYNGTTWTEITPTSSSPWIGTGTHIDHYTVSTASKGGLSALFQNGSLHIAIRNPTSATQIQTVVVGMVLNNDWIYYTRNVPVLEMPASAVGSTIEPFQQSLLGAIHGLIFNLPRYTVKLRFRMLHTVREILGIYRNADWSPSISEYVNPTDRWTEAEESVTLVSPDTIEFSIAGVSRDEAKQIVWDYEKGGFIAGKVIYVSYLRSTEAELVFPETPKIMPADIRLISQPDTLGGFDVYMKLNRNTPMHGFPVKISYEYLDGIIGAVVQGKDLGRVDQGIDMGVPKTLRLTAEVVK